MASEEEIESRQAARSPADSDGRTTASSAPRAAASWPLGLATHCRLEWIGVGSVLGLNWSVPRRRAPPCRVPLLSEKLRIQIGGVTLSPTVVEVSLTSKRMSGVQAPVCGTQCLR
jgi:hypothetical protein